jgi:3-deoxy-manno-octulosonate cytidylyltransferase (CMP-KDO synthetase)
VYRQCEGAEGIDAVYVATDDAAIEDEVLRFGGKAVMTEPACRSGTDRVAQAAERLGIGNDVIINVQGDEPLIDPNVITSLASLMKEQPDIQVATPVTKLKRPEELANPNIVKVAMSEAGNALYFSRSPIPYLRDLGDKEIFTWAEKHAYYKHIGVYVYRMHALKQFVTMKESPLERAERLEQLRLLEAGILIRCIEVQYESVAVDTEEDIRKVELLIVERGLG